jgi:hypothetical protein
MTTPKAPDEGEPARTAEQLIVAIGYENGTTNADLASVSTAELARAVDILLVPCGDHYVDGLSALAVSDIRRELASR